MADEDLPTYATIYVMTGWACFGCMQQRLPQPPPSVIALGALPSIAKILHDKEGLVCPEPRLTISFTENLMDSRLIGKPTIENEASQIIQ
jgi:hypothetical protein